MLSSHGSLASLGSLQPSRGLRQVPLGALASLHGSCSSHGSFQEFWTSVVPRARPRHQSCRPTAHSAHGSSILCHGSSGGCSVLMVSTGVIISGQTQPLYSQCCWQCPQWQSQTGCSLIIWRPGSTEKMPGDLCEPGAGSMTQNAVSIALLRNETENETTG